MCAQENPWAPKKGSNPWTTSKENNTKIQAPLDTAIFQKSADALTTASPVLKVKEVQTIPVVSEMNLVYIEKYKSYFYSVPFTPFFSYTKTIKDTIFLSADDGKILILDRQSKDALDNLESYAKIQYKAPTAFIGSFFCSAFLNIFSIPVNLISLAIPTYGKERFVTDYTRDNNNAKSDEIRSLKKGIQNKRILNTVTGTLTGIILNTIIWFNIF